MYSKELRSELRHEFSKQGLALLIYYGIMNVCVVIFAVADGVIYALSGDDLSADGIVDRIISNGWGYIVTCLIGALILLLWKKREFCFQTIWKAGNPMHAPAFLAITCIFISGQAVFQVFGTAMEWLFNLFDMSIMESMEAATVSTDTLSMFLYVGLFAPVFEEVLFRGLIMRSLEPYGKKFAIFASAFLFGIFHGNLVQSPYAFAVGLVLGYVAMEYNMGWAMVLHMLNNLILGDSLVRITDGLPLWVSDAIFYVIIWGCTAAATVICICKRKAIAAYFREGKIHPLCMKCFFTSPGILVITGVMVSNILLTVLMQLVA